MGKKKRYIYVRITLLGGFECFTCKELKWIRVSMKWIWEWISENYCWYIVVINGGPIAPTPNTNHPAVVAGSDRAPAQTLGCSWADGVAYLGLCR